MEVPTLDVSGRARTFRKLRKHTSLPFLALAVLSLSWSPLPAAPAPASAPSDPLGRQSPRSAVTGFLEACRNQDYGKAAQYLDLRQFSSTERQKRGPRLAKNLEAILNSNTDFNVLHLNRNPEGDVSDDADPNREHVATIKQNGQTLKLDLERVSVQPGGPQIWLFSHDTVIAIPSIHISTVPGALEKYLPPFLVSSQFLETPLWKWVALALLALLMFLLSRLLVWLTALAMKLPDRWFKAHWKAPWLGIVLQPLRILLCLAIFRIGLSLIDPSAIARLYIGRILELILVWAIALCLVRLVEYFMRRIELRLDETQQIAARTMLRLGERTAAATIVVLAILVVLQNWGYNTATLLAGLGVGGIAVALAAQQTIANIFGGVSLIGDQPIRIGEFGKFGDMVGIVEDIGMRSTRVRTLQRTIVSVPNSNFAGLNIENYSMRDKILFNPTFQIKRSTTEEQAHSLMESLKGMLANRRDVQVVPTPVRFTALASGSISLEIFCYVRTASIDEFYKIQGDLLLAINEVFKSSNIELA